MSFFLLWENTDGKRGSWALGKTPFLIGETVTIGRSEANAQLALDDTYLSRLHFEAKWDGEALNISVPEETTNPIYVGAKVQHSFQARPGESFSTGRSKFRIGGGATLVNRTLSATRERRIYEIFQELPEKVARVQRGGAFGTDPELLALETARDLIEQCETAKIVPATTIEAEERTPSEYFVLSMAREDGTTCSDFVEEEESTIQLKWAAAIPLKFGTKVVLVSLSGACLRNERRLVEDALGLADVVLQSLAVQFAVRDQVLFEEKISRFFSPRLREHITPEAMDKLLEPSKVVATIMFFDLRGFSKGVEAAEEHLDSILEHHEDLQECMGEVTEAVFDSGGIVIDFQGDALFACWGALGLEVNHAQRAAECVEEVARAMHERGVGFGMGIGTGKVIAGQVGGRAQKKFGIIANVVNFCARLEGLTKQLGVKILTNQAFADALSEPDRLRRVGRIQPAGLCNPKEVYQFLLPPEVGGVEVGSKLEVYGKALAHFEEGELEAALAVLGDTAQDSVSDFLRQRCLELTATGGSRDGVLRFTKK